MSDVDRILDALDRAIVTLIICSWYRERDRSLRTGVHAALDATTRALYWMRSGGIVDWSVERGWEAT